MVIPFPCNDEAGKVFCHRNTSWDSESVLLSITGTSTFILRWGDIESVAQGELDATGIVVLHLGKHEAIAVDREATDTPVEDIVAWEFDVKATFAKVLADTKRKYGVGAVEIGICTTVAVGVHIEVGLNQPVVWKRDDVA